MTGSFFFRLCWAGSISSVVTDLSITIAPRGRCVCAGSARFPTPASGNPFFLLASMRDARSSVMLGRMKPGQGAGTLRILIVDDSPHFLNAARAALEQDGITVVGVASAITEAIQLAGELHPDGILVDVDLGDESGLDLAREFAAWGAAPVILISAYPESELADLIADSPAVGFVSKSELSASVVSSLLAPERATG
jgi:CheY-like chemotaxis protein